MDTQRTNPTGPNANWAIDTRFGPVDIERTQTGFRVHHPRIGFAAYGEGRTVTEAMQELKDSKVIFEQFLKDTPEYEEPKK